jgi:uncharacterized protein (TIGR02145 family)
MSIWGYGGLAQGSYMHSVRDQSSHWSSTDHRSVTSYANYLDSFSGTMSVIYTYKYYGLQVRCVRD